MSKPAGLSYKQRRTAGGKVIKGQAKVTYKKAIQNLNKKAQAEGKNLDKGGYMAVEDKTRGEKATKFVWRQGKKASASWQGRVKRANKRSPAK